MSNKRKTIIFGAGQAGMMMKKWMPSECEVVCFADNDGSKEGYMPDGTPVMSFEKMIAEDPDLIIIAVLNHDAESAIRDQIKKVGYEGELRTVSEFRTMIDIRLAALRLIAERINGHKVDGTEVHEKEKECNPRIKGAVAELGVYRGEFAAEINRVFPDRELYLFDTFTGFSEEDLKAEDSAFGWHRDFNDTSVDLVKSVLPHPEKAVFVKGYFPEGDSKKKTDEVTFAFVSLDPDLYQPALRGLEYFYPLLSSDGVIMVHDYNSTQFPGIRRAVDEYEKKNGNLLIVPLMDLHGTAVIIKR